MLDSTKKFLKRVAENRSIEHLCLDGFTRQEESFKILVPYFEQNCNMRSIEILSTNLTRIPEFFSVIFHSDIIRIERISLSHCATSSNSWVIRDILRALKCMPGLGYQSDLSLEGNQIGRGVSIELSDLLKTNAARLQVLRLSESDMGDLSVVHLISGLMHNKTIRVLKLAGLCYTTPKWWQTFSEYLSDPSCTVEVLDLSRNNIGDEGSVALGDAMAINKKLTLKSLNLNQSRSVTSTGWHGLSIGLQTLAIEELHLRETDIDDDGVIAIVSALNSPFLTSLDMGRSPCITSRGWIRCFRC